MGRTIDMALESHSIICDLVDLSKRKHLETPGIGQDGFIPLHKLMEATQASYQFIARAEIKMISISQDDLSLEIK